MKVLKQFVLLTLISETMLSSFSLAQDFPWLAFGDLRGHMEPCGCDTLTDFGGLRRIYTLTSREKIVNPELVLFHLGNSIANLNKIKDPMALEKTPYIFKSLESIDPDVSLFNILEWSHLRVAKAGEIAKVNWVLSNADSSLPSGVEKFRVIRRKNFNLLVLGFIGEPSAKNHLRRFDKRLRKEWRELTSAHAKKEKNTQVVLLFAGNENDLKSLTQSGLFDLIISSNFAKFDKEPTTEEKDNPGQLVRYAENSKLVWQVPLGGQGILRGGAAQLANAPKLEDLITSAPIKGAGTLPAAPKLLQDKFSKLDSRPTVTWLDKSFESNGALADVFAAYNKFIAEKFDERATNKLDSIKDSQFAGADACQGCHKQDYDLWKNSGHAHAMETLIPVEKDRDPECVSCHSLAYGLDGGFLSLKTTPQYAGIQCENCHGPRRDHISNPAAKDPREKSVAPKDVCTTCHFNPHSSQFRYEIYWPKIKHGKL